MIIDIIGWLGSLLVVLAYALNIAKKLSSDETLYYVLNIAGSACLIVNTLYHNAIPSAAVNVVWVIIPLFALVRLSVKRGKEKLKG